jgi:hypothetical protein
LAWVYDYDGRSERDRLTRAVAEATIDRHYLIAPPDPFPVGSEHDVDLGLLGRQTAKVVRRDGEAVIFVVMEHQHIVTIFQFEKAVVK